MFSKAAKKTKNKLWVRLGFEANQECISYRYGTVQTAAANKTAFIRKV